MKRWMSAIAAAGLLGCQGGIAPSRLPDGGVKPPATGRMSSPSLIVIGAVQDRAAGALERFSLFAMVEAWKGSDPTSLGQNMKEIQAVEWKGVCYFLTATPNRLDIKASMEAGVPLASLIYDPGTLAWYAEAGLDRIKLAEWKDESRRALMLLRPDGTRVAVRPRAAGPE